MIHIMKSMDKIIVLMSTYNGEQYIEEQIESILSQEDVEVQLLVRDDGSVDKTKEILNTYKNKGKLEWYTGENKGPAKSFMDLMYRAPKADFYAFSDQDDYWLPRKLYCAVERLKSCSQNVAGLYYGNTTLVDAELKPLTQYAYEYIFDEFRYALVSSNATGCTMCFNRKLLETIRMYLPEYQIMHDGWIHKVCLAVGGNVFFDKKSYIYYRQHGNNVIGGGTSARKRWKQRINTIRKNPCSRSRGIYELYKGYGNIMSSDKVKWCKLIIGYRDCFSNKMKLLFSKEIFSPNRRINLMYKMAVMLGKF